MRSDKRHKSKIVTFIDMRVVTVLRRLVGIACVEQHFVGVA